MYDGRPHDGGGGVKTLEYTFDTEIEFSGKVREHAFALRCLPRRGEGVTVLRESWDVKPTTRCARQRDSFGNELVVGSAREPHDRIAYGSKGIVRIDLDAPAPAGAAPLPCHPMFKYATPLTKPDDALCAWADAAGFTPGAFADNAEANALAAFEELGRAVHACMAYEPGSTSVSTSAAEAFSARRGVCQDFSHIMLAVLRRAGIPARYVSGLAIGEGATHAWVQARIQDAWHGYDPTRDLRIDESYLPLAIGRDWSDCPIERGSFWGAVDQMQTVFMTVREIRPEDVQPAWKRNT